MKKKHQATDLNVQIPDNNLFSTTLGLKSATT